MRETMSVLNRPRNRYFVGAVNAEESSLYAPNLSPSELVEILISAGNPFALPPIRQISD